MSDNLEQVPEKYIEEIVEPEEFPEPILRDQHQVDAILLRPKGSSRQIYIPEPIFEEMDVAEILLDEKGDQILLDGIPAIKRIKMKVFKKFVQRPLKIPIPELFTTDTTGSHLLQKDVTFIRHCHADISFLLTRMIKEQKNYSGYIHSLVVKCLSITNTSKGFEGKTAYLTHSTFSKAEQTQFKTERQFQAEQQKKGLIRKLLNR